MIVCFRESVTLRSIAVGVLVMAHAMSALSEPFPFKDSNFKKKYSLMFERGLPYANYVGAGLSAAATLQSWIRGNYELIPWFVAGAALNILSAKVDPEKNPESNMALSDANLIWGLGHIGLVCLGLSCGELKFTAYWGTKLLINIANVVYRTSVAIKKK